MDTVHSRNTQNFIVYKLIVEPADVRFLNLGDALLAKGRHDKHFIHISVILERAVLDTSFQLKPQLVYIVDCQCLGRCLDPIMLIHEDLFFQLPKIIQRSGVYGLSLSELICPAVHVLAVFSL